MTDNNGQRALDIFAAMMDDTSPMRLSRMKMNTFKAPDTKLFLTASLDDQKTMMRDCGLKMQFDYKNLSVSIEFSRRLEMPDTLYEAMVGVLVASAQSVYTTKH